LKIDLVLFTYFIEFKKYEKIIPFTDSARCEFLLMVILNGNKKGFEFI